MLSLVNISRGEEGEKVEDRGVYVSDQERANRFSSKDALKVRDDFLFPLDTDANIEFQNY